MTHRFAILTALLFCVAEVPCQTPQSYALGSLVETEKAFAAMSVKNGMKKAFLTYLADDGLIFRPGPENGKAVWGKRKEGTAQLEWRPTIAFVSARGDLGYTTGPWIYTPGPGLDQPPQNGYFVSVWKKQKDGRWKLALDLGTSNDPPAEPDTALTTPDPSISKSGQKSPVKEKSHLLSAEKKLSNLSSTLGISSAFKELLTDDGRVYRRGKLPVAGRDEAMKQFSDSTTAVRSIVTSSVMSGSCDLAATYGTYSTGPAKSAITGYFLRIWRKQTPADWKLAIEVFSPISEK